MRAFSEQIRDDQVAQFLLRFNLIKGLSMKDKIQEDPPPVFQTWNRWYALVLGTLIALIAFFYLFTLAFR